MDITATQVLGLDDEHYIATQKKVPAHKKEKEQVGELIINGVTHPVMTGMSKIGRQSGCSIVISHSTVSKQHAEIESAVGPGSTFITDLNSSNKTKLNNVVLRPNRAYQLKDGDLISFGMISAVYKTITISDTCVPDTPAITHHDKNSVIIESTPDSSRDAFNEDDLVPTTQEFYENTNKALLDMRKANEKMSTSKASALDSSNDLFQSDMDSLKMSDSSHQISLINVSGEQSTVFETSKKNINVSELIKKTRKSVSFHDMETQEVEISFPEAHCSKLKTIEKNVYKTSNGEKIDNFHDMETQNFEIPTNVREKNCRGMVVKGNTINFHDIETQKIEGPKNMKENNDRGTVNGEKIINFHDMETQKLEIPINIKENNCSKTNNEEKNSDRINNDNKTDEFYDMATQKINVKENVHDEKDGTNDEIQLTSFHNEETQKIEVDRKDVIDDDSVNDRSTKSQSEDDDSSSNSEVWYNMNTQYVRAEESNNTKNTHINMELCNSLINTNYLDDENILNVPTQKYTDTNKSLEGVNNMKNVESIKNGNDEQFEIEQHVSTIGNDSKSIEKRSDDGNDNQSKINEVASMTGNSSATDKRIDDIDESINKNNEIDDSAATQVLHFNNEKIARNEFEQKKGSVDESNSKSNDFANTNYTATNISKPVILNDFDSASVNNGELIFNNKDYIDDEAPTQVLDVNKYKMNSPLTTFDQEETQVLVKESEIVANSTPVRIGQTPTSVRTYRSKIPRYSLSKKLDTSGLNVSNTIDDQAPTQKLPIENKNDNMNENIKNGKNNELDFNTEVDDMAPTQVINVPQNRSNLETSSHGASVEDYDYETVPTQLISEVANQKENNSIEQKKMFEYDVNEALYQPSQISTQRLEEIIKPSLVNRDSIAGGTSSENKLSENKLSINNSPVLQSKKKKKGKLEKKHFQGAKNSTSLDVHNIESVKKKEDEIDSQENYLSNLRSKRKSNLLQDTAELNEIKEKIVVESELTQENCIYESFPNVNLIVNSMPIVTCNEVGNVIGYFTEGTDNPVAIEKEENFMAGLPSVTILNTLSNPCSPASSEIDYTIETKSLSREKNTSCDVKDILHNMLLRNINLCTNKKLINLLSKYSPNLFDKSKICARHSEDSSSDDSNSDIDYENLKKMSDKLLAIEPVHNNSPTKLCRNRKKRFGLSEIDFSNSSSADTSLTSYYTRRSLRLQRAQISDNSAFQIQLNKSLEIPTKKKGRPPKNPARNSIMGETVKVEQIKRKNQILKEEIDQETSITAITSKTICTSELMPVKDINVQSPKTKLLSTGKPIVYIEKLPSCILENYQQSKFNLRNPGIEKKSIRKRKAVGNDSEEDGLLKSGKMINSDKMLRSAVQANLQVNSAKKQKTEDRSLIVTNENNSRPTECEESRLVCSKSNKTSNNSNGFDGVGRLRHRASLKRKIEDAENLNGVQDKLQQPQIKNNKTNRINVTNKSDQTTLPKLTEITPPENENKLENEPVSELLTRPPPRKRGRKPKSTVESSASVLNYVTNSRVKQANDSTNTESVNETNLTHNISNAVNSESFISSTPNVNKRQNLRNKLSISSNNSQASEMPQCSPRTRKMSLNVSFPKKTKPKILFTGIQNDKNCTEIVKQLDGIKVEDPFKCTILVTDKVRRTFKFLCALAQGIPIVSLKWLKDSRKCNEFREWNNYLLRDDEMEAKYNFKLSKSLELAMQKKLLDNFTVFITPDVTQPPISELKSMIMACGGSPVLKVPKKWSDYNVIITTESELSFAKSLLKNAPSDITIQSTEFILTGILRQEINFEIHKLV